ncbi:DUF296 domain-containing protein [Agrobacterium sp. a22-2]|uniref:PCC domain-containing protein n=1 Tax=Agrobacterium sp. a22-2 TaxID=2283840 RepID=UPI0034CE96AF
MAAVARMFAEAGCVGGVLSLQGGSCSPYRYVLPALASDKDHAAWYSDTFAPKNGASIIKATAIVGRRDGAPFLHCHGLWDTGEDGVRMGHMLPFDCVIEQPIAVTGFGSTTALFEGLPDPETNFTLFSVQGDPVEGGGLFLRVRPNEDICTTIETACRHHAIKEARIFGIGSIYEPVFENGSRIPCIATEIEIESGLVETTGNGPRATLDVAVVDVDGAIFHGRLKHGDNPVGVTFELLIVGNDPEATS